MLNRYAVLTRLEGKKLQYLNNKIASKKQKLQNVIVGLQYTKEVN